MARVGAAFALSPFLIPDIVDSKLDLVRSLGATGTVNVKGKTNEAVVEEILALTGSLPEVTLECSGAESSLALGIAVSFYLVRSTCNFVRDRSPTSAWQEYSLHRLGYGSGSNDAALFTITS